MALVIDLKPGEKILIGEAVITNDSQRTRLHIAGDAPILREKDIMKEENARRTPCSQAYYLIQAMYLSPTPQELHKTYFALVEDIQKAAPSCTIFFSQINDEIINERYYKAMKLGKQLMEHEKELLDQALGNTGTQG